MMSLCAIICGAESWGDIEEYSKIKKNWLQNFLKLENGIPTHDTFNRFFSNIAPEQLEKCFVDWISSIASIKVGEVISLDGKILNPLF